MAAGFPDISVPPTPPPPRPPSPPANPATVLASAALFTATTAVDEPARLPGDRELSSPMPESSGLAFVELSSPPPPSTRCANQLGLNLVNWLKFHNFRSEDPSGRIGKSSGQIHNNEMSTWSKRWRTFYAVGPAAPDPLFPLSEPRDRPPPRRARPCPGRAEVRLGAYGRVRPRHRHVQRLGA